MIFFVGGVYFKLLRGIIGGLLYILLSGRCILIKKTWNMMDWFERAAECERIADGYGEGWCKDRVLEQAAYLRKRGEIEKERTKKK